MIPPSIDTVSVDGVPANTVQVLSPKAEALILIVPGNPGVARLYLPFIEHLAKVGGGRFNIAVAAHAGHTPGRKPTIGPFFSLADQLTHHLRFWTTLPDVPTVHVVGHSIGAWLGLHVFDALPPEQRGRGLMLFPTIERMAQTPAGRRMAPVFGPLRHPALWLAHLLERMPQRADWLERLLLNEATEAERPQMRAGLLELSAASMRNVLLMAQEELATVTDLPTLPLERHAERLTLYYGQDDPWNLPGMAEGFGDRYPKATIVRCTRGISHSFMFGGSTMMADFVAGQLTGHLQ